MRYYLFKELIIRAFNIEDRNKIKNTSYYEILKNNIINDEDIFLKAKFLIFFEPSLLESINIKRLVYDLVDLSEYNELIKDDIVNMILQIYYNITDFDLKRFVMSQVDYLCNKEEYNQKIYSKYLY